MDALWGEARLPLTMRMESHPFRADLLPSSVQAPTTGRALPGTSLRGGGSGSEDPSLGSHHVAGHSQVQGASLQSSKGIKRRLGGEQRQRDTERFRQKAAERDRQMETDTGESQRESEGEKGRGREVGARRACPQGPAQHEGPLPALGPQRVPFLLRDPVAEAPAAATVLFNQRHLD